MRPGDRRQRWKSYHNISGVLMLLLAGVLVYAGATATKGGWIPVLAGFVCGYVSLLAFRDARRGWEIDYGRPPWADTHDAIDRKHGMEPLVYREPTEEELKSLPKYAFEGVRKKKSRRKGR